MRPLAESEIKQLAPSASPEYVDALVSAWGEMQRCEINTPLRLCNFLAQLAHESGGFTIVRENTNWSVKRMGELWPDRFDKLRNPVGYAKCLACGDDEVKKANLVYSGRADIGNKGGDDGWTFRGNGPMQDTGRYAAREAGEILGEDVENNFDGYNVYKALKVAIRKWQRWGCNRYADRHYIRAIGNKINRGTFYHSKDPIGHPDRLARFARAWAIFGDADHPQVPEGMALGAYGDDVKTLQARLRELGYGVGATDGVFGPSMARAVAAFKLDHKRNTGRDLDPDEIVGPITMAAINLASPAELAPERIEATEKQIIATSSTAAAGSQVATGGTAMVMAGAAAGAADNGLFDGMSQQLSFMPGMQTVLSPVASAAMWGVKNAVWVIPVVFGFWFWQRGRHIVMERAKGFWSGFNLSK